MVALSDEQIKAIAECPPLTGELSDSKQSRKLRRELMKYCVSVNSCGTRLFSSRLRHSSAQPSWMSVGHSLTLPITCLHGGATVLIKRAR